MTDVPLLATSQEGPLVERLDALSCTLPQEEFEVVLDALTAVVDRLLMGRLLTDPSFSVLRTYPDVYAGETLGRVEARLAQLGIDEKIRKALAPRLKHLLIRGQGHGGRRAPIGDGLLRALVAWIAQSGASEVRCNSCGYHFTRRDMGPARRQIVESAGLELSGGMSAMRLDDPIKGAAFTSLEIDHVTPRSGWGPSDVSNLQILCELCNQGKAIFESGFETISVLAAGGYSLESASTYGPNRTIFYASLSIGGNLCAFCGITQRETELTLLSRGEWFTPWTVDVACYPCLTRRQELAADVQG